MTKVAPTASAAAAPTGDSTPATPTGFLAHTGADTTSWIAGGAGLLVVAGAAALVVTRRRGWPRRSRTTPARPSNRKITPSAGPWDVVPGPALVCCRVTLAPPSAAVPSATCCPCRPDSAKMADRRAV
ncbi:LAETG motif-containing sortase-dependent surface protein [Streptomyces sp. C8S0]|uniref:LAETG motif-containing sortase-dependent surface protein n=1 Tax=Streptomyces sp. C8S0 TaxID=2585716 RepID=UPI001D047896|nr:LAETG motif-containing sortase-dependent surface protein [Streptomyces sp. C8S0]